MSVAIFALAACVSTLAVVLMARANPGVRLSFWAAPPHDPISVKVSRGLAIGCALFGAVSLDQNTAWWWGLLLIFAVLTLPFSVFRLIVNRHGPAQPGS